MMVGTGLCPVVCLLQAFYVNFVHLQHCLHDPSSFLSIFVLQHFSESRGNDLPRQAILVLQPAASLFFSAFRELLPQLVYFLLCLTVHEERYSWREGELRATI